MLYKNATKIIHVVDNFYSLFSFIIQVYAFYVSFTVKYKINAYQKVISQISLSSSGENGGNNLSRSRAAISRAPRA